MPNKKPRRFPPHAAHDVAPQPLNREPAAAAVPPRTIRQALCGALLFLTVFLAYQPAWRAGFIWDDNFHVTAPELRPADGLIRIWSELGATQQYYPLLHSAFWLQFQLWGEASTGYHVLNILMHMLATGLLLLVLRRLSVPGALFAAALFALHPVQVESVAWITELKNTLSGVCFFGAMLAYITFDNNRRWRWYAAASFLFVSALLSKSVTATLPGVLLVIFWWQRGHLSLRRDVAPLVPWFVIGAGMGLLTAWVERHLIGAEGARFNLNGVERLLLAGRVIWFYLGKLFWPADLMFIYPRWTISETMPGLYLFPLATAILVVILWRIRTRTRAPLAGFLIFAGCLFPVLGFFNVYPFVFSFVADHFLYLASAGIVVPVAAGLATIGARFSVGTRYAVALSIIGLLALLTWRQARMYRDSETLYRATIAKNPRSSMAHNNLGNVLTRSGRPAEAIEHYQEAVKLEPDYWDAHYNLGNALMETGRPAAAIRAYENALQLRPNDAVVRSNLGRALLLNSQWADAIALFREALRNAPDSPDTHHGLALALAKSGRISEAIYHFKEELRLRPGDAKTHALIATLLAQSGDASEAIGHYQRALKIDPDDAVTHSNLGGLLARADHLDEAISHFRQALQLNPEFVEARNNLANALLASGRIDEAIQHYEEVVRLRPDGRSAQIRLQRARALQADQQESSAPR